LNEQLYKLHLNCATYWNKSWLYIQDHLDRNLQMETEALYKRNKKIDNLMDKQARKTKQQRAHQYHNFYQRTINLTNITFTDEEQSVLNLGLQHSVGKPLRTCWINVIIETENCVKQLDHKLQKAVRILATNKLKQIYHSNNNMNALRRRHLYILNKVKHKIITGNTMLAQADKGRKTVIIYKHDYDEKVHTFLTENDIHPIPKNPINKKKKLKNETTTNNAPTVKPEASSAVYPPDDGRRGARTMLNHT